MQEWQQIQGFLSDGVITQDEVDQLPADSPFRQVFDSIAKNGQVTLDQLQQLRLSVLVPARAARRPRALGPGGPWDKATATGNDDDQNPQASPSATGTSS